MLQKYQKLKKYHNVSPVLSSDVLQQYLRVFLESPPDIFDWTKVMATTVTVIDHRFIRRQKCKKQLNLAIDQSIPRATRSSQKCSQQIPNRKQMKEYQRNEWHDVKYRFTTFV